MMREEARYREWIRICRFIVPKLLYGAVER